MSETIPDFHVERMLADLREREAELLEDERKAQLEWYMIKGRLDEIQGRIDWLTRKRRGKATPRKLTVAELPVGISDHPPPDDAA